MRSSSSLRWLILYQCIAFFVNMKPIKISTQKFMRTKWPIKIAWQIANSTWFEELGLNIAKYITIHVWSAEKPMRILIYGLNNTQYISDLNIFHCSQFFWLLFFSCALSLIYIDDIWLARNARVWKMKNSREKKLSDIWWSYREMLHDNDIRRNWTETLSKKKQQQQQPQHRRQRQEHQNQTMNSKYAIQIVIASTKLEIYLNYTLFQFQSMILSIINSSERIPWNDDYDSMRKEKQLSISMYVRTNMIFVSILLSSNSL